MKDLKSEFFKDFCKERSIVTTNGLPSFIETLFGDVKKCIVFHKVSKIVKSESPIEKSDKEAEEDEPHDVTGSPLHYSFGDETFDFTLNATVTKRNWLKIEENYLPINILDARATLNSYNQCTSMENPIFAISDAQDNDRTLILGMEVTEKHFNTTKVCYLKPTKVSDLHNVCTNSMDMHLKASKSKKNDVTISIVSFHELFGRKRKTLSDKEINEYEGSLRLKVVWNSLSFVPPPVSSVYSLIIEVAVETKDSSMRELWNQILLLDQYLSVLEDYKKRNAKSRYSVVPLKFSETFKNPFLKETCDLTNELQSMIDGNDIFSGISETENSFMLFQESEKPVDDRLNFQQYIDCLSSRPNQDFTDKLWRLLISSSNYESITDCIYIAFQNIDSKDYKAQINFENTTRFAEILRNVGDGNIISSLAGDLPLELLIDMGFQKLIKDYEFLLVCSGLMPDAHEEFQQMFKPASSKSFDISSYRTKLLHIAQLHVSLECTLIVERHLECTIDRLLSLFSYAYKFYKSEETHIKSINDLRNNAIHPIDIPISYQVIENLSKELPSSWQITLSSSNRFSTTATTVNYSEQPIFPPNIYPSETDEPKEEKVYYTTGAFSWIRNLK